MAFKDNILTFSDTKIVEDTTGIEVMMNWESPIMEKSVMRPLNAVKMLVETPIAITEGS